jgi:hypothetical protein
VPLMHQAFPLVGITPHMLKVSEVIIVLKRSVVDFGLVVNDLLRVLTLLVGDIFGFEDNFLHPRVSDT